jgi:Nucleosome assembly protein (NAP)
MKHPRAAGKDPTKKAVKKKGRRGAVQRKVVSVESFFNFFNPPQIPVDFDAVDAQLAQVRSRTPVYESTCYARLLTCLESFQDDQLNYVAVS